MGSDVESQFLQGIFCTLLELSYVIQVLVVSCTMILYNNAELKC